MSDLLKFLGRVRLASCREGVTTGTVRRVISELRCVRSINLKCLALGQASGALSKKRDREVGLIATLKDSLINSLCVLSRPDVNLRPHSARELVTILHELESVKGAIIMMRRSRRVVETTSLLVSVNPGTKIGNKRVIFGKGLSSDPAPRRASHSLALRCLKKSHRECTEGGEG